MAFSHRDSRPELIVDDGLCPGVPPGTGAVTAYRFADGQPHLVDGPVPDHQVAPCWMVISNDGCLLTLQMLIATPSPAFESTRTVRSACCRSGRPCSTTRGFRS